jgi:hypothetical protein
MNTLPLLPHGLLLVLLFALLADSVWRQRLPLSNAAWSVWIVLSVAAALCWAGVVSLSEWIRTRRR